jgi:hypothetical protein
MFCLKLKISDLNKTLTVNTTTNLYYKYKCTVVTITIGETTGQVSQAMLDLILTKNMYILYILIII